MHWEKDGSREGASAYVCIVHRWGLAATLAEKRLHIVRICMRCSSSDPIASLGTESGMAGWEIERVGFMFVFGIRRWSLHTTRR